MPVPVFIVDGSTGPAKPISIRQVADGSVTPVSFVASTAGGAIPVMLTTSGPAMPVVVVDGGATALDAPTGLSVAIVETNTDRLALSWTDASTGELAFEIQRKTDTGGTYATITLAAGATSYTNTVLTADTDYYYRVRAVGSGSLSAWCTEAHAVTTVPTGVEIFRIAGNITSSPVVTVSSADYDGKIDWGDGSALETDDGSMTHTYADGYGPFIVKYLSPAAVSSLSSLVMANADDSHCLGAFSVTAGALASLRSLTFYNQRYVTGLQAAITAGEFHDLTSLEATLFGVVEPLSSMAGCPHLTHLDLQDSHLTAVAIDGIVYETRMSYNASPRLGYVDVSNNDEYCSAWAAEQFDWLAGNGWTVLYTLDPS